MTNSKLNQEIIDSIKKVADSILEPLKLLGYKEDKYAFGKTIEWELKNLASAILTQAESMSNLPSKLSD